MSSILWTLVLGALPAPEWTELSGLSPYKAATGWSVVADAKLRSDDPKFLAPVSGEGAIYNGPLGRALNLVTKEPHGDVEVQLEFLLGKGSNAGIKLLGLYEIQMFDSFGVEPGKLKGSDNGGVYPRAELLPKYHHIDEGTPPKVNASKAPGEWQTIEISFLAPRFDESGEKTADAKFVKVTINGQVVQENVGVSAPTGHAWRIKKEVARGPVLLQADHGPVAFRNVKVRALATEGR